MEREISLDRHVEGRGPAAGEGAPGVYYLRDRIVNLYLVADRSAGASNGAPASLSVAAS